MSRKLTTEEFIQKAINKHNNKYDYSLVEYEDAHKKVKIICKIHGKFEQLAYSHLSGQGCGKCGILSIGNSLSSNIEEFIKNAKLVHDNRYDYSFVEYKRNKNKVKIICKEHGEFLQTPNNHLNNQGCPSCSNNGFDINKPAYLYYIRFDSENNIPLYKIGVTNSKVKRRIQTMQVSKFYQPIILQEIYFEKGTDAIKLELQQKHQFKEFKYIGDKIMATGSTELFTKDILGLDVI